MSRGIRRRGPSWQTLALLALAVLAGCGSAPTGASTVSDGEASVDTDTPGSATTAGPETTHLATTAAVTTMTKHPGVESVLYDLVRAENRTAFASEHDLRFREGRVLVVVELDDGTDLPAGYDPMVTAEFGSEVEAYVDVDDLLSLVGEETVRVVHTPSTADPQG